VHKYITLFADYRLKARKIKAAMNAETKESHTMIEIEPNTGGAPDTVIQIEDIGM
jgi:hypothetical protein